MQVELDQISPIPDTKDQYEVHLSASIAGTRGGARRAGSIPLSGIEINFYAGGVGPKSASTDEDGRAETIIPIRTGAPDISIEARVPYRGPGQPAQSARRFVAIPRFLQWVDDLELLPRESVLGSGNHVVNATVVNQFGKGLKDPKYNVVRALGSGLGDGGYVDLKVNDSGVALFEDIQVRDRVLEVEFVVLGTSINRSLKLCGPRQRNPVYRPPSDDEVDSMGFIEFTRTMWNRGRRR